MSEMVSGPDKEHFCPEFSQQLCEEYNASVPSFLNEPDLQWESGKMVVKQMCYNSMHECFKHEFFK
jgi:hypothetical protein